MDKFKVEEGTVQETLMMPLYGRVYCEEHFPNTFPNKAAKELAANVDYDFNKVKSSELNMVTWGLRARMLQDAAKDYLMKRPKATIINLGCGLDLSFSEIDNGTCRFINMDQIPIENSRELFSSWGECFQNVRERPLPVYVRKSREVPLKWKIILSLGMRLGMVKLIDVSFSRV